MRRTVTMLTLALALVAGALAAADVPAPTGFRADLLASLDDAAGKVVQLAEAVPADKYGWRPAPGVRSFGEVVAHIAGGNYFLLGFAGAKPAAEPADLSKETDKAKLVAELKKSYDFTRQAIRNVPDADLDKAVKLPWTETTERGLLLAVAGHTQEHLGQSIAYARMNGITPPWSAGGGSGQ
jgi:uncharacterized damage-inducible protein DinB